MTIGLKQWKQNAKSSNKRKGTEGMDKKTAINHLIEKGKAAGKLSTQDIDSLIIE